MLLEIHQQTALSFCWTVQYTCKNIHCLRQAEVWYKNLRSNNEEIMSTILSFVHCFVEDFSFQRKFSQFSLHKRIPQFNFHRDIFQFNIHRKTQQFTLLILQLNICKQILQFNLHRRILQFILSNRILQCSLNFISYLSSQ